MPIEHEMRAWTEHQIRSWIPDASLDELRAARHYPINSNALDAIQVEVHRREAVEEQRVADTQTRRQFRIATAIAIVALIVSLIALLKS